MMRSMFAGVSGLRNHQLRMDVVGNNIANVNTVGFKRGTVSFQDMLSQTLRGASSPQGGRGGSNPQQVGLGVTIGSIDTVHTQGSSQSTGKTTDMMVNGDGFFVVADGNDRYYSRAGNFDFDTAGNLINPNGMQVQGWVADAAGTIDNSVQAGNIAISKGVATAKATTEVDFSGNLDADAASGDQVTSSIVAYDSLGNSHTIDLQFEQSATDNEWTVTVTSPAWAAGGLTGSTLAFAADGTYDAGNSDTFFIEGTPGTGAEDFDAGAITGDSSIILDLSNLTQFAGSTTVSMNHQNGAAAGVLTGFSVDQTGVITGRFSNGMSQQLAQVALANFTNAAGLVKDGDNLYAETNNSGSAQVGAAGTGGRGDIIPGALEMSNVDLSQEFTEMIITQRGFQANSRIITTSDEMLQELVNLKR